MHTFRAPMKRFKPVGPNLTLTIRRNKNRTMSQQKIQTVKESELKTD
jgi:hypothetical protein